MCPLVSEELHVSLGIEGTSSVPWYQRGEIHVSLDIPFQLQMILHRKLHVIVNCKRDEL
jgi:hypothetical protein